MSYAGIVALTDAPYQNYASCVECDCVCDGSGPCDEPTDDGCITGPDWE